MADAVAPHAVVRLMDGTGGGFGPGVIGGGGGAVAEGGVWSLLVVLEDELVELCLELRDRRWCRSSPEPLLQGLVEALYLAAGGGVVGTAVLLGDAKAVEEGR